MATVIYGATEVEVDGALWRDGEVWLPRSALTSATGWEVRPECVCAGDTCVPMPPGATWWDDEAFNLSAFARHLGLAEAADSGEGVVAFAPAEAGTLSESVEAPDFTLPDLDGQLHSLSDYRGQKVMLLAWASF
ncbi:MAG TPA: redoxin domain-containing protein [Acidimicrobiia bacterium]|nr:redoxin domain-containing protein [Acidimicrobiia bacterium]